MKIRAGGGSFRAGGGSFRAAGCSPLLFLFMGNTKSMISSYSHNMRVGPAGDGETQEVLAKCLNGHLLRPRWTNIQSTEEFRVLLIRTKTQLNVFLFFFI